MVCLGNSAKRTNAKEIQCLTGGAFIQDVSTLKPMP
jgi:hypothetical protein